MSSLGACMDPDQTAAIGVNWHYLELENLDNRREPDRFTKEIWSEWRPNTAIDGWGLNAGCPTEPNTKEMIDPRYTQS